VPELADVEGFRRTAQRAAGRRVERVEARAPEMLRNTSARSLTGALRGERLGEAERRGKWLLLPAGRRLAVFHFGMTGGLHLDEQPTEPGPHDRLLLHLDRGVLRYSSVRKLGGIWLAKDEQEAERVLGDLGPDAAGIGRGEFRERIGGRRGQVKQALMDQEVLAGLGNELADEVLWRARLAPQQAASGLSREELDGLFDTMRSVLKASMREGQIPRKRGWLRPLRDERGGACPRCASPIERSKVGGRTTLWCPSCQGDNR
jgi:formamidopyrimidine-DNA glycosylase